MTIPRPRLWCIGRAARVVAAASVCGSNPSIHARTGRFACVVVAAALLAALASTTCAALVQPPPLADVAFDQHLGARVPLGTAFTDTRGDTVTIGELLDGRPAVLVLGYYECPNLCSVVRQALRASLDHVALRAQTQYRVIAVSIDPSETSIDAVHAQAVLDRRGSGPTGAVAGPPAGVPATPMPGWHFLTGARAATQALATAVGFHYVYDATLRQYMHPSGIVIVTPEGRISRYFFGVDYPPGALRASLVAASGEAVGSPVRALLLRCFHYDPVTGRYSGYVVAASRFVGVGCAAALLMIIVTLRRRERRRERANPPEAA
jgi:protein SCO1